MRRLILTFAVTALTVAPFAAQAATGKEVFIEQKCNKCHKVSSEGIAPLEEKPAIIDLSGVGKDHDVAWFKGWLNKEIERDSTVKKGEKAKHKIAFKGTPAELDIVAGWLKTLTKK
jgi:hypothetical protein